MSWHEYWRHFMGSNGPKNYICHYFLFPVEVPQIPHSSTTAAHHGYLSGAENNLFYVQRTQTKQEC